MSETTAKHPEDVARKLEAAFKRHLKTQVTVQKAQALSGGASAETWRFQYADGTVPGKIRNGILRCSSVQQTSQFSTTVSKRTEAVVQQCCAHYDIPVPEIFFCLDDTDALGEGYVMSCVEGETIPRRILRDAALAEAREKLTHQCGQILGKIHQVDITGIAVHLEDQSPLKQLNALETLYRSYEQPSAVFEVALHWLKDHAPAEEPLALVHGDFRNGNLVITRNGIASVLDWELCHLGNPIEDLGWLCVNAWCFGSDQPVGGFGAIDTLLASYQQQTGRKVSREELRYWQVFGTLRWGIICLFQANCYTSGLNRSLELAAIGRRVAETEIDILNLME